MQSVSAVDSSDAAFGHRRGEGADPVDDARAAAEDAVYRKVAARLLPYLAAAYVLAYLDRSNIGFAKLQTNRDLGFSEAVYGMAAGIFYLGYSFCELPSNLLMNRFGAKATMTRIMILWGVVSGSFAFMQSAGSYYVLRFLLGCAEAGLFPGILLYLTYWIPARRRARITAMFMAAIGVAGVLGGPLSGWIMASTDGAYGWRGWQWMFVIEAAPAVLLGMATRFLLTDKPEHAAWLNADEKRLIAADLAAESAAQHEANGSVLAIFRDRRVYALAAMAVPVIAGMAGISLWLTTILSRAGVKSVLEVGLMSAVPYMFAIVAQQWVARRSDRLQERRWHAATCAFVAAAGWLAMPLVSASPWLSLAALTVAAMGTFGITGPFWAMPAAYLRGTAAAGGIALLTTAGSIASFLSPVLVGWATTETGSLVTGQLYYCGLMLAGAACLLLGTRPGRGRRS